MTQPSRSPTHPPLAVASWPALKLFLAYRGTLWGVLFISLLPPRTSLPSLLQHPDPMTAGLLLYLLLLAAGYGLLRARWPSFPRQVQLSLMGDIAVLTLLTYATGGAIRGFGLLIAISVTLGSLLSAGSMSLAFAAAASLAVLAAEILLELREPGFQAHLTEAGLLGITYFAVALLSITFAHRLRETERVADQRGIDLANLARLNEHIIQRMHIGVLVLDAAGDIRLANHAAKGLLGDQSVPTGTPLQSTARDLDQALRTWRERPVPTPFLNRPLPGAAVVRVSVDPLGANPNSGLLVFLEDNAQIEQRAQEIKLTSLGRLSASIAHEIRNPLGAISHAGQLLGEISDPSDTTAELLSIIERNVRRLNELVDSVLQLTQRNPATPQEVALGDWLPPLVEELNLHRLPEDSSLRLEIEPDLPPIQVDPRQLRQVLSILCDNAYKHGRDSTKAPAVLMRVQRNAERGAVYIDVIDHGPGIAPEVAPYIFDPLFTTDPRGTGLGLYLAKELCEANRILLDHLPPSEGGTCFRLTFRTEKANEGHRT